MSTLDWTIRGVAASAPGTLAMDASLYRRYRRDGGDAAFPAWESSEGLQSWDDAAGPALVAKRLLGAVLGHEPSGRYARLLNNAHALGVRPRRRRRLRIARGLAANAEALVRAAFGAMVWASGYVVLPLLGVYQPIWKYDLQTLAKDLGAHLVFGTATAAAFRLLTDGAVDK